MQMGFHSPTSKPSPETREPDSHDEHGFGYPLRRMVPLESVQLAYEESLPGSLHAGPGLYKMPTSQSSSTSSHMFFVDFEAVVDEYLSHYNTVTANSESPDLVIVEASTSTPSGTPASLLLRRVKRDSTELAILQSLNLDEIRSDPWNPAPNLLYTAERGEDAILCFERLFSCDNPPLQTVANVIDYIGQVLEGLCFLHEHNIVHHAYGDPKGVMMDIGRPTTTDFDRTRFPVRYYRINFAMAQQLSRDADPRGVGFCGDVSDCGAMCQALVERVPRIGGKLRSLVVAMTSGEYDAEGARKLFEALCQGIDASTYDAPLQPIRNQR